MNVIGQMSKEQYLTWKNSLLNLQLSEAKYGTSQKMSVIMEKDSEIQRLKIALYKVQLQQVELDLSKIKEEFQAVRKDIETQLGYELAECVIDEITLEVKKL